MSMAEGAGFESIRTIGESHASTGPFGQAELRRCNLAQRVVDYSEIADDALCPTMKPSALLVSLLVAWKSH
jgi:hypothetical protein